MAFDLWIEQKEASANIRKLQADRILGSAYIEKTNTVPWHILYYDVIANNKKPRSSPWWQFWRYKLETGFLYTRYTLRTFKNWVIGKKHPLDVVCNATKAVAKELKLDYRLGIDYQSDGRRYYTVEIKEGVDDKQIEQLTSRLRTEPTLKSFEISRSKNLLKFLPTA